MSAYKVSRYQATRWMITRHGAQVAGTGIYSDDQQHMAIQAVTLMNMAFEAGKFAQKLETEAPMLAALCN